MMCFIFVAYANKLLNVIFVSHDFVEARLEERFVQRWWFEVAVVRGAIFVENQQYTGRQTSKMLFRIGKRFSCAQGLRRFRAIARATKMQK